MKKLKHCVLQLCIAKECIVNTFSDNSKILYITGDAELLFILEAGRPKTTLEKTKLPH